MYEHTEESTAQANREDEEFIKFVESVAESRSGVALAAVEASKREVLENLFGQYGAEALVLASDPDHVLWTDDLIQAQVSAQEFGVRRVWTQLLLGTLGDEGLISLEGPRELVRAFPTWFTATPFNDEMFAQRDATDGLVATSA